MNKKFFALVLAITLIPTAAIAATPKPTQAQIDAAKKIEAEKKAAADAAAARASATRALRRDGCAKRCAPSMDPDRSPSGP